MGNIVGSASQLIVYAIVPRAFGAASYGDFVFLTTFFSRLVGFLGLGTPLALNNRVAQRPSDTGLTTFFVGFVLAVGLATVVLFALGTMLGFQGWLWPGQVPLLIGAAALWAWLSWTNQVVGGVADSYGCTVITEKARMWQSPLLLLLIIVIAFAGWLNVATFFIAQFIVLVGLTWAWILALRREGHPLCALHALTADRARGYGSELYEYSHPLVVHSAMAFVTGVGERLILQTYGGSIEQGHFGLSYQLGAMCFVFTAAMTPVLSREFSVAAGEADLEKMAALFRRYVPLLYSVAAMLAAFVATQADRIVLLIGGREFADASVAMAIMAFYPIHQTYGQLSGSIFYATGQTALYRNIGLISMTVGLALSYFLIAPPTRGGIGAGAVGLAARTVVVQVLVANCQLYFNTRLLGLRFRDYLVHQVLCLAGLLFLAGAVRTLTGLLGGNLTTVSLLVVTAAVYSALVLAVGLMVPGLFGLSRDELRDAIGDGVRLLTQRRWSTAS